MLVSPQAIFGSAEMIKPITGQEVDQVTLPEFMHMFREEFFVTKVAKLFSSDHMSQLLECSFYSLACNHIFKITFF